MAQNTHTVLYNGRIHTLAGRTVSALVLGGGRVLLAGTDGEAHAFCRENGGAAETIDLRGRCVLPGFTDSHTHLCGTGREAARLDLHGAASPEEIVRRGREYLAHTPVLPGGWVVGCGFDQNLFETPVLPDGAVAEAISSEVPVLLDRVCSHVGTANRAALRLAGFDEHTVIPGGALDKDAQGRLTGVLREAALDRLKAAIPPLDASALPALLRQTGGRMAAAGLTAIHSNDVSPSGVDWPALYGAAGQLTAAGEMPLRIYEEWEAPRPADVRRMTQQGIRFGSGSEWCSVVNVKLFADGSLGARTAALRAGYADAPEDRGILVHTQEEMNELVALCQQAGLPVAFHAIGDGALAQCVTAVETAQRGDTHLRHRLVHCQIGDAALYRRLAAAGMGADIQPAFLPSDAPLVVPRLGGARAAESYAWRTLLESGVHLGGGSDSPVECFDPLWGIYCAVTRQTPLGVCQPEQRLTVAQAVALYTTGPAWLAHRENVSGTLEAGKYADLVVLSEDIFAVPPQEIPHIRVLRTMAGGRTTWAAE